MRPARWPLLLTVTTRDPGTGSIRSSSRPVSAKWPRWLVPSCSSNPSAVVPRGGIISPALLMSRSRREWLARICSAAARTESSEARSRRTTETVACGAAADSRATARSALPVSRQARIVTAARCASTAAASNPMPVFAPVTTAVRPCWPGTSATVHGRCLVFVAISPPWGGPGRRESVRRTGSRAHGAVSSRAGNSPVKGRAGRHPDPLQGRAAASGGDGYARTLAMHIPSPSDNGFHLGPLFIHYYGLMYVIGITLAILITQRRWKAVGGDPSLVGDVALWAVPAGIIGGRIYFDLTTPKYIPHHWYGFLAVWDGGLGIWAASRRTRPSGSGGCAGTRRTRPCSRTRSPRRCWWRRRSGASVTTSTRNCSAARPACHGGCTSRRTTGRPDTSATPRSSPRSCTS